MGTRADFYVGVGPNAQWLGSVAWDGYEWAEAEDMPTTEEGFRAFVEGVKKDRKDFTSPEEGWPWPWKDSATTDFTYAFHGGEVEVFVFGQPPEGWPDMTDRQNVQLNPEKGGIFII